MRNEEGSVVDEVHGAAVIGEHPILLAGKFPRGRDAVRTPQ